MGTEEDVINMLRAAFAPGADPALKRQAADVLRSLVAVLDATPGAPLVAAPPVAAPPATAAPVVAPPQPDKLAEIIERYGARLSPDERAATRCLNIPMIQIPPSLARR